MECEYVLVCCRSHKNQHRKLQGSGPPSYTKHGFRQKKPLTALIRTPYSVQGTFSPHPWLISIKIKLLVPSPSSSPNGHLASQTNNKRCLGVMLETGPTSCHKPFLVGYAATKGDGQNNSPLLISTKACLSSFLITLYHAVLTRTYFAFHQDFPLTYLYSILIHPLFTFFYTPFFSFLFFFLNAFVSHSRSTC